MALSKVSSDSMTSSLNLSNKTVTLPAGVGGKILQVIQQTYTGTTSWTSTSPVGIVSTGITPVGVNSKFLIMIDMKASHTQSNSLYFICNIGGNRDLFSRGNSYPAATGSIYMEAYGNSHSANAQIDTFTGNYVYTSSGNSPFTITVEAQLQGGTGYMNKSFSYDDSARGRPLSSLIVMEIAS